MGARFRSTFHCCYVGHLIICSLLKVVGDSPSAPSVLSLRRVTARRPPACLGKEGRCEGGVKDGSLGRRAERLQPFFSAVALIRKLPLLLLLLYCGVCFVVFESFLFGLRFETVTRCAHPGSPVIFLFFGCMRLSKAVSVSV